MLHPANNRPSNQILATMQSHINDTYSGLVHLTSDLVGHKPLFLERPPTCPPRPNRFNRTRLTTRWLLIEGPTVITRMFLNMNQTKKTLNHILIHMSWIPFPIVGECDSSLGLSRWMTNQLWIRMLFTMADECTISKTTIHLTMDDHNIKSEMNVKEKQYHQN